MAAVASSILKLAALVAAVGAVPAPAKSIAYRIHWNQVERSAGPGPVEVRLTGGAVLRGDIQQVGPNTLVMNIRKTNDRVKHPTGTASLDRIAVAEIRRQERTRVSGRLAGLAIGGAGLLGGLALIVDGGFEQKGSASSNAKLGGGLALLVGGIAGGATLGRHLDQDTIVLRIVND
jgi:hypothetical protein